MNERPVFTYSPALPYEEGVTRRDPSPVIEADGRYHVWYSRTTEPCDGYSASLWHATSNDGHAWTERGEALPKGPAGAFDEHAVFTPTILVAKGQYFLFYTAVPEPFTNDNGGPNGTPTAVGVAVSDSPEGPWRRFEGNPVLHPSEDPAEFDSMRVDDTCLVVRQGKYWMYYKGRQIQRTPGQTKMGLAIADRPTGPYVKVPQNPVVDGGHEVCCWPQGTGVGALFCNVGPAGNTLQYSDDGINFHVVSSVVPPKAPGPFRQDNFENGRGPGIAWGIAMEIDRDRPTPWPYLVRFDVGEKQD